eukprot:763156-Hanusia_phi.AAC.3
MPSARADTAAFSRRFHERAITARWVSEEGGGRGWDQYKEVREWTILEDEDKMGRRRGGEGRGGERRGEELMLVSRHHRARVGQVKR